MDEVISIDSLYNDEHVPEELYVLVQNNLVDQLTDRLDSLTHSIEYLTAVSWHGEEKLSLLMIAALNGYEEIVRILFAHCQPQYQIELKGRVAVSEGNLIGGMTALQCACYRAHFTLAKTLIDIGGADVNNDNDDLIGYPLLIQASKNNRLDIVRFLIENGYSDINKTQSNDQDRCTALIWAAFKGYTTMIEYLLEKGADINYSCKSSKVLAPTPITFAVLRGNVNAVRLLCDADADTSAKFTDGRTLLMVAADNKYFDVIEFLLNRSVCTIDELELSACSLVTVSSSIKQLHQALELLALAIKYRVSTQTLKICIQPILAYDYHQECQSVDELDAIKDDRDRMWIEIALIRERILLPRHDSSFMRSLQDRGDLLVSRGEFEKCLQLWIHAFYLYQNMEMSTYLHPFVWLFCKMITENHQISIDEFLKACYLVFESSQIKSDDETIGNALCLVIIATKITKSEDRVLIIQWISKLCRLNLVTQQGKTLLHLCVDNSLNEALNWRRDDILPHIRFPNKSALQLLLTCAHHWLDLDAAERIDGSTALHLACQQSNEPTIIKCLVNAGAHIDCVNLYGETPIDCTKNESMITFLASKLFPHRLKCLCARLIADKRLKIHHHDQLTFQLNKFIVLHDHRRAEYNC
ncbi:unnamed protein product [Rotaria socialis]|uniref:Uncharacterized protein n=1 Tax=Rotaria socialis TaxID=392032 RepID=A0A820FWG5_9BILA|nr:unnamed protein product [Rotaria socialis]CAF3269828.1 unnamed protein product [Rotaria socialis]CAF4269107.1 unnamed protein product [Rotaria socialis]CAF4405978.1 unnamed protein product [Rotaria socialis]